MKNKKNKSKTLLGRRGKGLLPHFLHKDKKKEENKYKTRKKNLPKEKT